MDLDALRFANFKALDDAVDDWSTLVDSLDGLKRDADDGLRGAAGRANWAGVNATVSKEFIGKTAGEFQDAHTQAKSIHRILSDTRDELKRFHRRLNDAVERALKKNLTVTPTGDGGFTVRMNIHPDRAGKGTDLPDHGEGDVTALRDEIQRILDDATESDTSAGKVLKAIADQSTYGFSGAKYKDRDSAVAAVERADELSKLAKKDPQDLSLREFDMLYGGLKKYASDPLFAERFATKLGAKGTLEFWAGVNEPGVIPDLNDRRHYKFDDLQKYLSLTLASATQSDSAGMVDWTRQMVDQGGQPVRTGNGVPFGFQVMSNLMRWGNYDDSFLNSYGTALMETEKRFTDNGERGAWQSTPNSPYLNRTGSDTGSDPMTGFLKGLSNSPGAATAFLNDTFTSKGNGEKSDVSNFQYLFEKRDWPEEENADGESSNTGRNNLALALEAGTTGHPAGELPTADTPPHTAEQARLMESVVSSVSQNNTLLTEHPYMADSFGQMASEYLHDMNRSMTNDSDGDTDRLFPIVGEPADFQHRDVTRFLFTVGQHPEGYAAVEVGQKSYMAQLMAYHLDPDLPADQRYAQDPQFVVENVANGSGEVAGTLAQGRAEAVAGEAAEKDKAYEESVARWKDGISGGIGTGIGVGTSYIASPVGGAVVGGVAETVTSAVLEDLFKNAEGKAKGAAGLIMGEQWDSGMEENNTYTKRAAELAAEKHHRGDLPDVGEWARTATERAFKLSESSVNGMAPDLKTDI
ncbi:DUF6571 family protein [Streptomyces aurantiacus]|uniref:DUF6571 domain-containing protein n=1 Tax=Streptomyces aurantiacus JA 4570 TaxID=1286094 RepID=S3ZRV5_9ACTN|nr:DUF6571 family protein [Streptomyces aurantiacus]EPH45933.1 hypothetical protein STRAU_1015 [Streptomyces aurantiacus JA 4570]